MNASTFSSTTIFRQRWFLAGLSLFFLAITLLYFLKVHHAGRSLSAIQRWQPQIREIDDGATIWAKYTYPNPPIMVLILKPLADLSPMACSMTWLVLKAIMDVLAIHWVFSLLERPGQPFPLWAKLCAVLLVLRPIQGDLMHGNVNLFILFLVTGTVAAFCQKRDALAGLALALAIACKVTPALSPISSGSVLEAARRLRRRRPVSVGGPELYLAGEPTGLPTVREHVVP